MASLRFREANESGTLEKSLDARGLKVRYFGGDGVDVSSPGSSEALLSAEELRLDVLEHMPSFPCNFIRCLLVYGGGGNESIEDADEIDEDLEKPNGEEEVEESESLMVSGLDVIEHDSDERRVRVDRTKVGVGARFEDTPRRDTMDISSVAHLWS